MRTPGGRVANPLVEARSYSTPLKKGEVESGAFDPTSFRTAFSGCCGGAIFISPAGGLWESYVLTFILSSTEPLLELLYSDSVCSLSLRCIFAIRLRQ